MMNIIFWIIVSILLVIGSIFGIGIWLYHRDITKEDPEYVLQFLKGQRQSNDVSFYVRFNGEPLVKRNPHTKLPLASTVKYMVAVEFARQAAEREIDTKQKVSLEELDHYYIPKTDGGAHEAWLEQIKKDNLTDGKSVALLEVVKGMMLFSSNANTDYLIRVLGQEKINATVKAMHKDAHDPLYPIVGALFVPLYIKEKQQLSNKELLTVIQNISMEEYRELTIAIHEKWTTEPPTEEKKKALLKIMNMKMQKVWSDRLPAATTSAYIDMLQKLNSKADFSKEMYQYLKESIEHLMKSPANQEWLQHAGTKGGSTAFVSTDATYATDKKGNTSEFALFANNLKLKEQMKLTRNMNGFKLKILTDASFREKVKAALTE